MMLAIGADGRNRTGDLRITNALLYQLSYIGGGADYSGTACFWDAVRGYNRARAVFMRVITRACPSNSSVASMAGVCGSPVTSTRTGMASFGILRL